jgi:SAM-dependent methyltransferase
MQKFLLQTGVTKFFYTRNISGQKLKILDIGLDNSSLRRAQLAYSNINLYHGLDVCEIDAEQQKKLDKFFLVDLDQDTLEDLENNFYDLIIMNHVLEHLENGLSVVENLSRKVSTNGHFFIEFPNVNSLKKNFFCNYHFHCDSTHKRIYQVSDISNILLANDFEILSAGYSRPMLKVISAIPRQILNILSGKPVSLPHLSKKISHVYARKL